MHKHQPMEKQASTKCIPRRDAAEQVGPSRQETQTWGSLSAPQGTSADDVVSRWGFGSFVSAKVPIMS